MELITSLHSSYVSYYPVVHQREQLGAAAAIAVFRQGSRGWHTTAACPILDSVQQLWGVSVSSARRTPPIPLSAAACSPPTRLSCSHSLLAPLPPALSTTPITPQQPPSRPRWC